MGCASSAALPFLARENESGVERQSFEKSSKLNGNGIETVKNAGDDKMKEISGSSAVQGVIGGVVQTKDELLHHVKGVGETISGKVNNAVNEVEEKIESTFDKISTTVGTAEEKVKTEVKALEVGVQSLLDGGREKVKTEVKALEEGVQSLLGGAREKENGNDSIKPEDIDELLDALPSGEETAEFANKTTEIVKGKSAEEKMEESEI